MIDNNSRIHFLRTFGVTIVIVLAGFSASTLYGVSFPDYFPLDPAVHGVKTFEWTYGRVGSYQSYISGTHTVPYTSGAIEGTGIVNCWGQHHFYATNDGSRVQWIGATELEDNPNMVYFSTDCELSDHPESWTFSTVTDNYLLYQGITAFVDSTDLSCKMDDNAQSFLFDLQNVTVPFAQYNNAIIIWYIDETYTYKPLDFGGKDVELGIKLPSSMETGGYSVTDFDIYAHGVGLIAHGGIDGEPGELLDLAVLVAHESQTPHYRPQTVVLADSNKEYMFIKDTNKITCWAGEDYGAVDFVAINDNNDNQNILVPSAGFHDQQGIMVGYNVNDESETGALCALTEYFNAEQSGPGGSGLPTDLSNSTLEVDIDFIVPENPSVTTLQNGMGFWLEEADGDSFDTDGVIDLVKGWHTYTYDISNLSSSPSSGTFGDSPVVLFAIEFYDPTDPLGLYKIVYFVDNFKIIGDEMFFEDFEDKCTDLLVGDLNNDCKVNLRDLSIMATSWLQDSSRGN